MALLYACGGSGFSAGEGSGGTSNGGTLAGGSAADGGEGTDHAGNASAGSNDQAGAGLRSGAGGQSGASGSTGGAAGGSSNAGASGSGGSSGASSCGGLRGATCSSHQFCDYPDKSQCGAGDATGVCRAKPDACTQDCPGACGCDGKFYCNACLANVAGVDVTGSLACKSTGMVGDACDSDAACSGDLRCCYPCGIPGCANRCTDTGGGPCPLLP